MILKSVKHIGDIYLTQGQYTCHCCRYKSDTQLTGFRIYMNPATFTNIIDGSPNASSGYSLVYPSTAGTYDMTFSGIGSMYENLTAKLTVINAYEFVIEFCFIVGRSTGYLNPYSYNSYNQIFAPISGTTYFDMKVTVVSADKLVVANCYKEVFVSPIELCNDSRLLIDGAQVNGWQEGKDLEIEFAIFDGIIDDIYHAVIIRVDSATDNQSFIEDLELNYALASNTANQITTNLPFAAIIDSRVIWQESTGFYTGKIKIDKDYFTGGGSYIVYFVYKDDCKFKSCYTNIITEEIINTCPILDFPFITNLTDFDHTINYSKESYLNILPCKNVELSITIDKALFKAELVSKGFNVATFESSLIDFSVYATSNLSVNATQEVIQDATVQDYTSGTNDIRLVRFEIPISWAGKTKYVFFKYTFNIEGNPYTIVIPTQFTVANFDNDIAIISTHPEYYCFEEPENVEFCFSNPDAAHLFNVVLLQGDDRLNVNDYGVVKDGATFDNNDGCVTVDYTELAEDTEYCLKIQGEKSIPCPLTCPCDYLTMNWERNKQTRTITVTASFPFTASDVVNWKISDAFNRTYFDECCFNNLTFQIPYSLFAERYLISHDITMADGCIYHVEYRIWNHEEEITGGSTKVWLCNNGTPPGIEAMPCVKDPVLDSTCNIAGYWESNVGTDGGTIVSYEYSHDLITWANYTVPVNFGTEERIYFKLVIDYGLPCGIVTLYQCLGRCETCFGILPVNPCGERLTVSHSQYSNSLDLLSTETCTPSYDTGLMYSFDGITWFNYTGSIDITNKSKVYYRRYIECSDGCSEEQTGLWEVECNPCNSCSGDAGEATCSARIEAVSEECEYTLDHYNPYYGTGEQSFYSTFIPYTGFSNRSIIESRIRVDLLNSCVDGIVNTCYYIQQGYYYGEYTNDLPLQNTGRIDDIRVYQHNPSTSAFTLINLNTSAVSFTGSGSAFATALRANIVTGLSAFGLVDGVNYTLFVSCTNAGYFRIRFVFRDNDINVWSGINKNDARLRYRQTGAGTLQTRTQTQQQGCPQYSQLDPLPDCQFTNDCAENLRFRALPVGGVACGSSDYVFIEDTEVFNFHRVPLSNKTTYTIHPISVLSQSCLHNTLVAIANNFGTPITYEWKKGTTVLGNLFILKTFETGTIDLNVTDGICSASDSTIL